MTYILNAQIYVQSSQDPDNLESNEFWKSLGLFYATPRHKKNKYQMDDVLSGKDVAPSKPFENPYLDGAGNPRNVKLEFDIQPEIFSDLEKAGLKIGPGGDVEVSIDTITGLGITLFLEYYPYHEEKDLSLFNGNVFIPMHRLVSINALYSEAVASVYVNKAILKGDVESHEK